MIKTINTSNAIANAIMAALVVAALLANTGCDGKPTPYESYKDHAIKDGLYAYALKGDKHEILVIDSYGLEYTTSDNWRWGMFRNEERLQDFCQYHTIAKGMVDKRTAKHMKTLAEWEAKGVLETEADFPHNHK